MISTVFMKKAKIPVTVDIQRVTGILYVLKCQRWEIMNDYSMIPEYRFTNYFRINEKMRLASIPH